MTEEFNLSKRRQKELRPYLISEIGLSIKQTNAVLKAIKVQDEEFIRRLKDKINKEVDYTPCDDKGCKDKSDPVFGMVNFRIVKEAIDKLK